MSLYDELGGFDVLLAVTRRWHELCLADPEAAHPFEHGLHPQHDERLAAYLAEVCGGPALFTAGYGDESSMQRLHAGNGEPHPSLDAASTRLFTAALNDIGVPAGPAKELSDYFIEATAGMEQYVRSSDAVPPGLPIRLVR